MTGPPARRCLAHVHSGPSAAYLAVKCSSTTDSAMFASSGDRMPPCGVPAIVALETPFSERTPARRNAFTKPSTPLCDPILVQVDVMVAPQRGLHHAAAVDPGGRGTLPGGSQCSFGAREALHNRHTAFAASSCAAASVSATTRGTKSLGFARRAATLPSTASGGDRGPGVAP